VSLSPPVKLRPYGRIEICVLLLLLLFIIIIVVVVVVGHVVPLTHGRVLTPLLYYLPNTL